MKLIVAMDNNRGIGLLNALPWKNSNDMNHFKTTTTNNIVVMGRKTFESIGKPLPNRINLVLSSDPTFNPKGAFVYNSLHDLIITAGAFSLANTLFADPFKPAEPRPDIYVIGGATIYKQLLPYCTELIISQIDNIYECDTFFPEFEPDFKLTNTVDYPKNEKNKDNLTIKYYNKI